MIRAHRHPPRRDLSRQVAPVAGPPPARAGSATASRSTLAAVTAATLLVLAAASAQARKAPELDPRLAREVFAQARALTERDNGKLWGVSLAGPILLADPVRRAVLASEPDSADILASAGGIWAGRLPDEMNVANTAVRWGGRHWTMLVWPLPGKSTERAQLLGHELWHRVQESLGLPMRSPGNAHLDMYDARLWLRLEWHALAAALKAKGPARKTAIADALAFRRQRRALFPRAAREENGLELNEGLAEYTGVMLAAADPRDALAAAREDLSRGEKQPTFVRSFAYASGPAYGLLLDEASPGWRADLTPRSDLGTMLGEALALPDSGSAQPVLEKRALAYGLAGFRSSEQHREVARARRLASARARFVDGPVLMLPLQDARFSFDPRNAQPLDTLGTVYPTLRITDMWGVLEVTGGALMAADGSSVTVPAPGEATGSELSGDGWTLKLKDEWRITVGKRTGDRAVVNEP